MVNTYATGKTAVRRNKPSRPLKFLLGEIHNLMRIINRGGEKKLHWFDLGCGRGDDMEYLRSYLKAPLSGSTVQGYDPNHKPEPELRLASGKMDIVTCFYVLNVLLDEKEREDVLLDARRLAKDNGLVVVAARGKRELRSAVRDGWIKTGDGWVTKTGTFQRGFDSGEIAKMMFDIGFEMVINLADNSGFCMVVGIDMPWEAWE